MTSTPISGTELANLLRESRTAFRLEYQKLPLTFEMDAYLQYIAGAPLQPHEWPAWQEWLDRVRAMTSTGRVISRVAILGDPPAPYQEWRMWGAPWHRDAGESILFLPSSKVAPLNIRAANWWLFDDSQAVTMTFTEAGGVDGMRLFTGTEAEIYCRWRDLAVRHATTAETVTA